MATTDKMETYYSLLLRFEKGHERDEWLADEIRRRAKEEDRRIKGQVLRLLEIGLKHDPENRGAES